MEILKFKALTSEQKKINELVAYFNSLKTKVDASINTDGTIVPAQLGNATNTGQELTREVTLTPANIVAMYTTPVEVIPAPGAGKYIEVLSATLIYDYATAAYTGGGAVTLNYGSGGAAITANIAAANAFAATGDKVYSLGTLNAAGGYTMPLNTSVVITNATGVFVNPGTAAGVGRLHVVYRIHTSGL